MKKGVSTFYNQSNVKYKGQTRRQRPGKETHTGKHASRDTHT